MSSSSLLIFDGGGGPNVLNITGCEFSYISDSSIFEKNFGKALINISNNKNSVFFSLINFSNLAASKF